MPRFSDCAPQRNTSFRRFPLFFRVSCTFATTCPCFSGRGESFCAVVRTRAVMNFPADVCTRGAPACLSLKFAYVVAGVGRLPARYRQIRFSDRLRRFLSCEGVRFMSTPCAAKPEGSRKSPPLRAAGRFRVQDVVYRNGAWCRNPLLAIASADDCFRDSRRRIRFPRPRSDAGREGVRLCAINRDAAIQYS